MANLKLTSNVQIDIPVTQMKDGDLAVITLWNGAIENAYVGRIVHRYKSILITVGGWSGCSWPSLFETEYKHENCRVRLLQKGDTLVVE